MKALGIDLGSYQVKIAEVHLTKRGATLVQFLSVPLKADEDPEIQVLEVLKKLASQFRLDEYKIVLGLKQDFVSTRLKTFPFTEKLKIMKSLPFELEDDLAFSLDAAIFDARIVCTQAGGLAEVLAVATPSRRIGELIEKFSSPLNGQIDQISPEGLATANCVEDWDATPPQRVNLATTELTPAKLDDKSTALARRLTMCLQMGHMHTTALFFDEGRLISVRSFLWGGRQLAEAIGRKYELAPEDATLELNAKSFILLNKSEASYDQIIFSDSIAASLRELTRELKLALIEVETDLGGKVGEALVTGGVSGIMHLCPFLTQQLEIPVNLLKPFQKINLECNLTLEQERICSTAVGLAIEALRKPRSPGIQLRRGEFAVQSTGFSEFWHTWGVPVQVALSLVACFYVFALMRESVTTELVTKADEAVTQQATQVLALPKKEATEGGIKRYIRSQRKKAGEMKALAQISQMNSALDVMAKISKGIPGSNDLKIEVTRLHVMTEKVHITGTVGNGTQKQTLERALKSLSKDGQVKPLSPPALPAGSLGVSFAYELQIDRGMDVR